MTLDLASLTANRELSPYTGWTRAHWVHLAQTWIGAYLATLDEKTSMPVVGGRIPANAHLETVAHYGMEEFFDRHLILAAAWLKGTGITKAPGWKHDLAASCRRAIVAGTTPGHPHAWGELPPHSAFGNGLAMAILIAPEHFWDPLGPSERMNVGLHMKRLAEHSSHDNNHWYFHLAGVPIMERCGIPYDRAYFEEKWERLFGWYRGDGWYIDGSNQAYDYYNHWGFHYFNLLLYCGHEAWRERYGERIREVTRSFLRDYPLFFGADGASVPWGRSLIYRHALLAPLLWAQYAGISPLGPGLSRRIASGNLRYFFGRQEDGSVSPDGLLTPGYREHNPNLLETYNDQGSGYWSATGMVALALPPAHPFWTAVEEPLPADRSANVLRRIDGPKFLLHQHAGRARLFCFEQPRQSPAWQLSIKYGQQVYDGGVGFGVVGERGLDPGFNRVGYRLGDSAWHYRSSTTCEELADSYGVCSWTVCDHALPQGSEIGRLYQCTVPGDEVDIHMVYHTCGEPLFLSFGGLCIDARGDEDEGDYFLGAKDRQAGVGTPRHFSAIAALDAVPGSFRVAPVVPEDAAFASHLHGGRGVFPVWTSVAAVPSRRMLVFASRAGSRAEAAAADPWRRARDAAVLLRASACDAFADALERGWRTKA